MTKRCNPSLISINHFFLSMFLAKILWTFFHSRQYLGAKALAVVDTARTGYAAEGIVALLLMLAVAILAAVPVAANWDHCPGHWVFHPAALKWCRTVVVI
jgi:hypothetical protein